MHISFLHKNAGNILEILPLWNHDLLSKLGKRREYKNLQFSEDYCSFRSCPGIGLGYPFAQNRGALWWPFPDLKGSHILVDFWMWIDRYFLVGAHLVAQAVKPLPAMRRLGWIPGQEDPWRRKWKPTAVLLPEKLRGWRSLVGYSPWRCRVGHDWTTSLSLYGNYYKELCFSTLGILVETINWLTADIKWGRG